MNACLTCKYLCALSGRSAGNFRCCHPSVVPAMTQQSIECLMGIPLNNLIAHDAIDILVQCVDILPRCIEVRSFHGACGIAGKLHDQDTVSQQP